MKPTNCGRTGVGGEFPLGGTAQICDPSRSRPANVVATPVTVEPPSVTEIVPFVRTKRSTIFDPLLRERYHETAGFAFGTVDRTDGVSYRTDAGRAAGCADRARVSYH